MDSPAENPATWLARQAPKSAAAWHALAGRTFRGEASVETTNGVYRFRNGVFVSRLKKPLRSFEAPKEMLGLRLIGFLAAEVGSFSLSPRWRHGTHCVLWRPGTGDPKSFMLTSPCLSYATDASESSHSGVQARRLVRPPSIREPEPPSMTRLHPHMP
jgi:hypothetical protein